MVAAEGTGKGNAEPTFMVGEVQIASGNLPEPTFMVGEVQIASGNLPEPTFMVGEVQIASSNLLKGVSAHPLDTTLGSFADGASPPYFW